MEKTNTRIIVLTTVYNCEDWIQNCVKSIQGQTYQNFECYLLDDMSTDGSVSKAEEVISGDDRFHVVRNTKKFYQAGNYDQIIRSADVRDDDIIVEIDGDDWLPDNDVFQRVFDAYSDGETWLAFGQFKYADGRPGFAKQIPVSQCRTKVFTMSHMRTWKAFLWRAIKVDDLYTDTGWYSDGGGDVFFMTPMYEMATERHTKFMPDINYVYNEDNPINDHKRTDSPQHHHAAIARSKKPYSPINFAYGLITPKRFDLIAKLVYAAYRESGLDSDFGLDLYREHLRVWNGFKEYNNPDKNTFDKFRECFDEMIDSMKLKGFDKQHPVPVTPNGDLLNGAHRTAASFITNSSIKTLKTEDPQAGQLVCSSEFFKSLGLDRKYLDYMALEYSKLKPNTRVITLHPARDPSKEAETLNKIYSTVPVVYDSTLSLTESGFTNYISQLYFGEPWLTQNPLVGASSKSRLCWGDEPVRVILIEEDDKQILDSLKGELRASYGIDKSSLHINDTHEETIRIARVVFNPNSVKFLNTCDSNLSKKLMDGLRAYTEILNHYKLNQELFCITGSAIMSLFGLRECSDLDYLHFDPQHVIQGSGYINSHEKELGKYPRHKDDIIFNPNNHFFWNGIKFATLDVVKELKAHRGEEKDVLDVKLMEGVNV